MAAKCYLCGINTPNPCTNVEESESCGQLDAFLKAPAATRSDGGSSSYYHIPKDATDLQDLIEDKEMSFARGNLFKALYRLGEKEGIDHAYDLNKMQWFLDRMKRMHSRGLRL